MAMDGVLGYELDSTKLSKEDKALCRDQIRFYKKHYKVIAEGDYYRLSSPYENPYFTAWQHVSRNRKKSLVSLVITDKESNDAQRYVKLKGLDKDGVYKIEGQPELYSGAILMYAGIPVPPELGEYEGIQMVIKAV